MVDLTIRIGANSKLFRKELDKVEREVVKRNKFLDRLDKDQKAVFLARERRLQAKRQSLIRATTIAFAASVAGGVAAAKAFASFESALIATVRTTGLAGDELETFKDRIKELSEELGESQTSLLKISEAAGTLGIRGAANLSKFTEAMAKFDVASATLRGGEAARAIARIIQLSGGGIENVDRFASEIAFLADNFNSTEAEIVSNATELAKLSGVFKLSTTNLIALSAGFATFGFSAEIGRTSLLLFSKSLDNALREGGDDLKLFMKLTGFTREELERTFRDAPEELFIAFSKGLRRAGDDATKALDNLGLANARTTPLFLSSAGSVDVLSDALRQGNEEYIRNTKLNKEVALEI